MRFLAALFAIAIVAAPFAGCGGTGSSVEIGCITGCSTCSDSEDCCDNRVCTMLTSDGDARCSDFNFQCKLGE
jgi:hypothetical protein